MTTLFKNSSCSLPFDTKHEVFLARGTTAIISTISCLIGICLFIFFRLQKSLTHRLSLYLLISALLCSSTMLLQILVNKIQYENSLLCAIVGFMVQFSIWTKFLFTTVVVVMLSGLVLCYSLVQKVEYFYVPFSFLFPITFTWIPFLSNAYGLAGGWCWIRTHDEDCNLILAGLIEQFALCYAPLLILCTINTGLIIVMTFVLSYRACKKSSSYDGIDQEAVCYRQALKETLPLIAYPIIFQILGWLALANRLYRAISDSYTKEEVLWVVHALADPSWGFFSGVTFVLHLLFLGKFKLYKTRQIFSCCKKSYQEISNLPQNARYNTFGTIVSGTETVTSPTEYELENESTIERAYL